MFLLLNVLQFFFKYMAGMPRISLLFRGAEPCRIMFTMLTIMLTMLVVMLSLLTIMLIILFIELVIMPS